MTVALRLGTPDPARARNLGWALNTDNLCVREDAVMREAGLQAGHDARLDGLLKREESALSERGSIKLLTGKQTLGVPPIAVVHLTVLASPKRPFVFARSLWRDRCTRRSTSAESALKFRPTAPEWIATEGGQ
ncbi:hypothetical protein [Methylobacterium sp. NEAU K]|uniref:hypothetical protein n=1 Tax=Methylobacterium sp. NEAU K TaxID=3064946 RepID=UPI002734DF90|nr:hypothetical protein [Methylobacterium sp. NEAU K]MDP4003375.1 hypothetical protein [Methylobacterium sp. NEAU K]